MACSPALLLMVSMARPLSLRISGRAGTMSSRQENASPPPRLVSRVKGTDLGVMVPCLRAVVIS